MSWVQLTLDVPLSAREAVEGFLWDAGVALIETRDAEVLTMPNVRAPRAGEAIVVGYFDDSPRARKAARALTATIPTVRFVLADVVERDWAAAWRDTVQAHVVGRIWVGPPWARKPHDKVTLEVEPKMAFGTGDHPTTQLCLLAVDEFLARHPKATVLDVGTGTGVLALAAKKLGAGRTVGIDIDDASVEAANECARLNRVSGVEFSKRTLESFRAKFDLVLANIVANTLIELAPALTAKCKGRLVLAGILVEQVAQIESVFRAHEFTRAGLEYRGEWARLDLERAT